MEMALFGLLQLLEDGLRGLALLLGGVVDEEDAVEMVDLVLEAASEEPSALALDVGAVKEGGLEEDLRGAGDVAVHAGQ